MPFDRLISSVAAIGLCAGLFIAPAAPTRAEGPSVAQGLSVRTGLHKDYTRLVLETPSPVPFKFSFPKADEIVISVTGAVPPEATSAPARGIIEAIEMAPDRRGSRLVIHTKARADIRRQFTILPKDGKGARIVIDLAAAETVAPAKSPSRAKKPGNPRVLLPAPHTSIIGDQARLSPAPRPAPLKRKLPTEPFEVAGGTTMLFDAATPEQMAQPVEIAQAGGISISDWLLREGANPNIRAIPPAPAPAETVNPPAPAAYPAQPVQQVPIARPAAYWAPPSQAPRPAYSATPAAAAPDNDSPATRYARQTQATPGEDLATPSPVTFYAGLGLGMGMFDYESDFNNTTVDEDLFAWKLLGGYRFNSVLSAELSYGKVGGLEETFPSGASAESTFYGVTASALMAFPVSQQWVPFGRLGAVFWWESANNSSAIVRKEETGTGAVFGFGADYLVNRDLTLRGEWELYLLSDTAINNVLAASVLYNF